MHIRLKRTEDYRLELQTADDTKPDKLPFFRFAIPYLEKKHREEADVWHEINANLQTYNVLVRQSRTYLRSLLSTRMRDSFVGYHDAKPRTFPEPSDENYYDLDKIFQQMYDQKYDLGIEGKSIDFNFHTLSVVIQPL